MIDKEIIEDEDFVIPEFQHFINTREIRFTKYDNHKYDTFYVDDDYNVKCLTIGNVEDENTLKIINSRNIYLWESTANFELEREQRRILYGKIEIDNNGLFDGKIELSKEEIMILIESLKTQLEEFE